MFASLFMCSVLFWSTVNILLTLKFPWKPACSPEHNDPYNSHNCFKIGCIFWTCCTRKSVWFRRSVAQRLWSVLEQKPAEIMAMTSEVASSCKHMICVVHHWSDESPDNTGSPLDAMFVGCHGNPLISISSPPLSMLIVFTSVDRRERELCEVKTFL